MQRIFRIRIRAESFPKKNPIHLVYPCSFFRLPSFQPHAHDGEFLCLGVLLGEKQQAANGSQIQLAVSRGLLDVFQLEGVTALATRPGVQRNK